MEQIDAFWTVKANADDWAKHQHKVGSSWTDHEYAMLRDAMCERLLPIVPNLLDPPVLERFNEAFHFGWQQLDKRDDQTTVAKNAVTVEKHMP